MKYCNKCGKELMDEAVVCPGCGCPQEQPASANDSNSFGWALLGFCIPLVGLILYLVWKDSTPMRANKAGKGALVSVIVSVVLYAVYALCIGVFIAAY